MSKELKAVQKTVTSKEVAVTQFFNQCPKLQLTQGIGNALKGEAGFIQVDKLQALALINTLAAFVGNMSEEQYLESLHSLNEAV